MNFTTGLDVFIPSTLLFGKFPRIENPGKLNRRMTADERVGVALVLRQ